MTFLSLSPSSSLLPSSSSSSSGQVTRTNSRRWKNKINKKMNKNKKTMATVIATPKVTVWKEKKKKTVRFQLPSSEKDAATVDGADHHHQDRSSKGSYREICLKRIRDPNTWYTSQELKSFRADIFLTINWMVLNGISDCGDTYGDAITAMNNKHKHSSKGAGGTSLRMFNHKYKHYAFCSQGVEGRTPIGKLIKQKRRKDAVQSVLKVQKMQLRKQHEQENYLLAATKEEEDEQQQQHHKQANVKALAFVYASHCKESSSSALHLGKDNAKEAATIVTEKTGAVHLRSLCDDSDSEDSDSDSDDDDGSCSIRSDISSSSSSSSSSSYSSLFCNDDNDNYDDDIEDESGIEVELFENFLSGSASKSSSSSSSASAVPTWMKSSLSSSLFGSTSSSFELLSDMISDVIETATTTITTV